MVSWLTGNPPQHSKGRGGANRKAALTVPTDNLRVAARRYKPATSSAMKHLLSDMGGVSEVHIILPYAQAQCAYGQKFRPPPPQNGYASAMIIWSCTLSKVGTEGRHIKTYSMYILELHCIAQLQLNFIKNQKSFSCSCVCVDDWTR